LFYQRMRLVLGALKNMFSIHTFTQFKKKMIFYLTVTIKKYKT